MEGNNSEVLMKGTGHGVLTLKRALFSYILVFLVPTLILVIFVRLGMINNMLKSEKQTLLSELEYARLMTDEQLSSFTDIVNIVYFDDDIASCIAGGDLPANYRKFSRVQTNLRKLSMSNSLIDEMILYIPGTDCFVSTRSSYLLDHYFHILDIDGISSPTALYDYLNTYSETPRILYGTRRSTHESLTMYVYSLKSTHNVLRPVLIFVTTDSGYRNAFSRAVGERSGAAFLTDGNGRCMASYVSGVDGSACLAGLPQPSDRTVTSSGGLLTACLKSACGDMYYYCSIDEASALASVHYIGRTWICVIGFVLLLGLATAIVLGRQNYEPIRMLKDKASTISGQNTQNSDDYQFLSGAFDYLDSRNELLQNSLDDINDYLLLRLLRGAIGSAEEASRVSGILGFPAYNALFRVLIAHPRSSSQEVYAELLKGQPDYVRILMRRAAPENTVLLVYDKDRLGNRDIPPVQLSCPFSCGSIQTDIRRIPLSYAEATVGTAGNPAYSELCARLEDAVRRRGMEQVQSLLAQLSSGLENGETSLQDAKLLTIRYLLILHDAAHINELQRMLLPLPDTQTVLEYTTPEDCAAVFRRFNADFVRELVLPDAVIGDTTNAHMIRYLENHYNDLNFSFQQMAEDFNLTLPVLSRQFLDANGQNLTDYMTTLKIETAKRLLTTTDLSVTEIAMRVGYYNVNSFIRRFKQITDTTPGKYKQAAHEKSSEAPD